jgi:S1-C subfamily serine protease
MRKLVIALLVALFSTTALANVDVSELQKSVVNIKTNKVGGHGSGTFIDPFHILTVWHITQGMPDDAKLTARTYDGTEYNTTGDLLSTQDLDIGILTIDATKPYEGPVQKIKCGKIPPLTPLINVGNPLQFDFVATNMYTTGGRLSPAALEEISKPDAKPSPPEALRPGLKGKKKKKTAQTEEELNTVQKAEEKRVFNNLMIVNGPIVSGNSGSALFDTDGNIVGVLHITLTSGVGNLTGLGGAVEMSGSACQWIKDQVGEGVFAK